MLESNDIWHDMTFGILLFEFCAIYLFVQHISPLVIYWLFNISPFLDISLCLIYLFVWYWHENVYSYWMFIHTECVFILFIHSYRMCIHTECLFILNVYSFCLFIHTECVTECVFILLLYSFFTEGMCLTH